MYMCVCACGQERALLLLPAPPVRVSAPDRSVVKRQWDSRLRVDDEVEQSIDFPLSIKYKHRKWEYSIAAKVRTANY